MRSRRPAIRARWGHELGEATPEQIALIASYLAHLAAALAGFHRPNLLIFGGGVMKTPGLIESLRDQTRSLIAGYLPEWDDDLTRRIVAPSQCD